MVASRTAALRRFFSSRPVFSCKKKCRSLEEEAQAALIQVASEKQAVQHGHWAVAVNSLRRNVAGVKLEAVHCLKLEAVY